MKFHTLDEYAIHIKQRADASKTGVRVRDLTPEDARTLMIWFQTGPLKDSGFNPINGSRHYDICLVDNKDNPQRKDLVVTAIDIPLQGRVEIHHQAGEYTR